MIYKVTYDVRTPTSTAYGRVWIGDVDDQADAELSARHEAVAEYPSGIVERLTVHESTDPVWQRHKDLRARQAQWRANTRRGDPNPKRGLL